MTQQLASQIAVHGIFFSSVLFVAAVSAFWPWWRSQLGWTIVAVDLALTVAVAPAMLMYWLSLAIPGWLQWVSVFALWLIPPAVAWRAVVLYQVQRRGAEFR